MIVSVVLTLSEQSFRRLATVGDRLQPTIDVAKKERAKFGKKGDFPSLVQLTGTEDVCFIAERTGLALNIAIGLQVLLGALTTGLPAAASPKHASFSLS
jgi:SMODS and SLOG-associating 2TM effector domain